MITMIESHKEYTISEAMDTIPERDLVFIATYNPTAFKGMCVMWGLELELQKEGKLEEYTNNLRNSHIQSAIDGYSEFMKDKIKESNDSFVTEAGDVENWRGGQSQEELTQELQEGLEFLENLKIK